MAQKEHDGGKKSFQKFCKQDKKFVRFFYESDEQPHWKKQNPQHWKQPYVRSLMYVSITISLMHWNSIQSLTWVSTCGNI